MLAPAEVPAITAPRARAAWIASPNGVPLTTADSLSWLPPVMKIPVTSASRSTYAGSWASSRLSGRTETTSAAPSLRKSASYTSTISGPSDDAVAITAIRALGPPLASTKWLRTERRRSLSSAPPMIMSGPGGVSVGMSFSLSDGMTGEPSGCHSWLVQSTSRILVIMRHAKAEPSAPSDHERVLTDRGIGDAEEAGGWLGAAGTTPGRALVSDAARTRGTWAALAGGAGWDVVPEYDASLYAAGPETALDLFRETDDAVGTLVVVGPQPDHGVRRADARRR